MLNQEETTASDQTQDQKEFQIVATSAVAAFKERLREKVKTQIKNYEEGKRVAIVAGLQLTEANYKGVISALAEVLKLIDKTP